MESNTRNEMTLVFEGEFWQASFIKQLLDEFEIPCFLSNELMSNIDRSSISAAGINPATVVVPKEYVEQSIKLIEEYNNSTPLDE